MTKLIDDFKAAAKVLAGRDVDITVTNDGKYVALWLSYGCPPPSKAKTVEEAYASFIKHVVNLRLVGKLTLEEDSEETVENEDTQD